MIALKRKCLSQRISFFLLFLLCLHKHTFFKLNWGIFADKICVTMRHICSTKLHFLKQLDFLGYSLKKVAFWNDCFCLWSMNHFTHKCSSLQNEFSDKYEIFFLLKGIFVLPQTFFLLHLSWHGYNHIFDSLESFEMKYS